MVSNDDGGVPQGTTVGLVSLQDGAYNHHVVLLRQSLQKLCRLSGFRTLGKLTPALLARAERKRHCPGFLSSNYFQSLETNTDKPSPPHDHQLRNN